MSSLEALKRSTIASCAACCSGCAPAPRPTNQVIVTGWASAAPASIANVTAASLLTISHVLPGGHLTATSGCSYGCARCSAAPSVEVGNGARSSCRGRVATPRATASAPSWARSEEHTSELQSRENLVCRLLLQKKKKNI